ncbi:4-(cytidine 5'-diphospho)-2-C-methyl-D-erythritol kinase [Aliishimia ponticola]|uniref:4-(cytidine 5'-diphospho)-2-C-methyl-D-erythritol kinase n=1 Tax=Aliishimia ponticola TaxID=2499833 RepID=UPI001FE8AEE0|nr:4-(cytidine 5'-diphospho)-2-C-methyl-D-erythritol kinase [Aliishimia ponticola]
MQITAPAKINLTLHVTGQRADGYHLLDSLVVFADIGDRLEITPGPELSLTVQGPFADGVPTDARNLVWRAAELAHWRGHIRLFKSLPHGAGIGGGSSDAAALLWASGAGLDPDAVLALGADVPVCYAAQPMRMRGIGERLDPVQVPPLPAVLVNPGGVVPTGQVFSSMASRDNAPMPDVIPDFADADACCAWLAGQRNDLEVPAAALLRDIDTALSELRSTGNVRLVRMSGSGATCFAIYPTLKAAKFAAYEIEAAHPDWWIVATTLGGGVS